MAEEFVEQEVDEGLQDEGTPPDDTAGTEGSTASPDSQDTEQKLLAGKYKSPEELEKAYKEAESTLGKWSQEKKELENRYNQLMNQFAYAQQQQQKAGQEYETEEEKLAKEVQNIKATITQQQGVNMFNEYVGANKELQGNVEKKMFANYLYQARNELGPYANAGQVLDKAKEYTLETLSEIRESARKETVETRKQVKSQQSSQGTARKEVDDSPKVESYTDYMAWRTQQGANARRTH